MSWYNWHPLDRDWDDTNPAPSAPAEFCALDADGWRGEADRAESDANWRGDQHLEDWPEHEAGPEYWMLKDRADREGQ